jgi:elongation factor P
MDALMYAIGDGFNFREFRHQLLDASERCALPLCWCEVFTARSSTMAALIEAIDVKRKMYFELEGVPYHCLDKEISTPTARGGQTLVRLKMRNLLTRAVFDKTFKADDKFKEPDLEDVEATYLYSDGDGAYFLDQTSFETLQLSNDMLGDALEFLLEGTAVQIEKYEGNPIGLQLPMHVELVVKETEPGFKGDTATGTTNKPATMETGLVMRVPSFVKEGDKIKIATESREFAGRM